MERVPNPSKKPLLKLIVITSIAFTTVMAIISRHIDESAKIHLHEQRMAATSILQATGKLRKSINRNIKKHGSISEDTFTMAQEIETKLNVKITVNTGDNSITIHNRRLELTIQLTPELDRKRIRWSCGGSPPIAIPNSCLNHLTEWE